MAIPTFRFQSTMGVELRPLRELLEHDTMKTCAEDDWVSVYLTFTTTTVEVEAYHEDRTKPERFYFVYEDDKWIEHSRS